MITRSVFFSAVICTTAANAQGIEDICLSLSNESFIETTDSSILVDSLSQEFAHMCSSDISRVERYNTASGQLRAQYGLFKASGGGGSTSGSLDEQLSTACETGLQNFRQFVQQDVSISSGRYIAQYIVDCARVVSDSNITRLFGTMTVSDSDDRFTARVSYVPGEAGLVYNLTQIEGDDTECTVNLGEKPAVGNVLLSGNAERVFTCLKQVGQSWTGGFQFEPNGAGPSLPITAKVTSRKAELEGILQVRRDLEDRMRSLEGTGKILAIGTTEPCIVDRVAGIDGWEEACRWLITLPQTDKEYDVLTSLVTYDFPAQLVPGNSKVTEEIDVTNDNILDIVGTLLNSNKISKPPIYHIYTEARKADVDSGFDIVLWSGYHYANSYTVQYIVVAK